MNYVHKVTKRREPMQIGSRIEVTKRHQDGMYYIEVYQHIVYDMPKYDKKVSVASLKLNETDYQDFVAQVTKEI